MMPDLIQKSRTEHRARIIAAILTNHGMPVTPPDEADLDAVQRERWDVCVEIAEALKGQY